MCSDDSDNVAAKLVHSVPTCLLCQVLLCSYPLGVRTVDNTFEDVMRHDKARSEVSKIRPAEFGDRFLLPKLVEGLLKIHVASVGLISIINA